MNMTLVLFLSLAFLVIAGVPVAYSIGLSSLITMLLCIPGLSLTLVAQRCFAGINSFPLMCVPFFIIAGEFMAKGNISSKLINFANVFVGRITGGLAHVNVLTSMLFGGVSGSAQADVASTGPVMIPTMEEAGYSRDFATALTATSATIGMIIPPSNAMIIYSTVATSVSVSAMFIAGIIPGILVGLAQMIVAYFISKKRGYPKSPKLTGKQKFTYIIQGFPPLMTFIIIMGGILGGIFTPTESAVIATFYNFFLAVFGYRTVSIKEVPDMLYHSAITTGVALFLISTSSIFGWILAYGNIPQQIARALLSVTSNKYLIYLMIFIILLLVGTVMDMTPALIIFVPIFLPIVQTLGMDAIQFGLFIVMALCIGLFTPPVGTVLFLACNIGHIAIEKVSKAMIPFMFSMIFIVLLVIFVPGVTLYLPSLFA
ncbi:MAG: TRAP transporter large permease [Sphaerochaeta sp.]